MNQLDLFEWAARRPTAQILDWHKPFAERVMERLYEYDDDWPKPNLEADIVSFARREAGAA
ncbi:hypothetical protein [Sinorhizobium fredii]|uniref:hypothetical protein n=1 Tax=Rhizobium fredii TaxID=380 RepID=UPI0002FAE921|nr:hypothetical protein [Sinorhizobium fredii]